VSEDPRGPGAGQGHAKQRDVDAHFDASTAYWRDIYRSDDFYALMYGRRSDLALRWVAELGSARGSRALDVGCGAGLLTIGLA
jgi:2-polyprenyl-3-methyl-5-hydroxy-6-metoxy-1,4-benzoquinol methylase